MAISSITEELARLSRDVRSASATLGKQEARYLVDLYYQMQDYRISTDNQVRSMSRDEEPHATIAHFAHQMDSLERQVKSVLDAWTDSLELGLWTKEHVGIGPVIAAGLIANVDFDKAVTAGHIWSFAGLDPKVEWRKGERRPWNTDFKTLCTYKMGESFVKNQNREGCYYGQVFAKRKRQEIEINEQVVELPKETFDKIFIKFLKVVTDGVETNEDDLTKAWVTVESEMKTAYLIEGKWFVLGWAGEAQRSLTRKRFKKDTDAYKNYVQGKLPPAHLHARARRVAVKLFLAHFFEAGYQLHYGKPAPLPYPIAHLGHTDYIPPIEGMKID